MKEIEKGQKANIKLKISSIREVEISCVIKWVEYDRIALIFPEDKNALAKYFFEGREIEVLIYTDKGIFIFDSTVIDTPFDYDFVVELPEERTKIQRRDYIRVPVKTEITLANAGQKFTTNTINVGGGGVRFVNNSETEMTGVWRFILNLPKWKEPVTGRGEILYNIKQDNKLVSVIKFTDIEEVNRNKIIKMCFEEEANRLKMKHFDSAADGN
ncbi:MAG: PilZ domain-containing protein [Candidatus Gastranaerophilales bacterium]|nr:PilZ domain-containing protein [Candidatus Gastranaerophilales bacterium]